MDKATHFALSHDKAEFKVGDRVWYNGGLFPTPMLCTIVRREHEEGCGIVYDNDLGHWGYPCQYVAALVIPDDPQGREDALDRVLT